MGSSTQADGYPVARAYFELLERISIYEASQPGRVLTLRDERGVALGERHSERVFPSQPSPRLRASLSNGVALHESWEAACTSALHELVERDRILRSFAGEFPPVRLDVPESALAGAIGEHYETVAYEVGQREPAPKHRTAMLFSMPRALEHPITFGFGTAYTLQEALQRAERESMQRLAFLWGEELPTEQVEPKPSPEFHQEYYLYPPNHARLTEWLAGQYRSLHARHSSLPLFDGRSVRFVDLTPAALSGRLAVAKAVSPSARGLRFGLPGFPKNGFPHPVV
jgi:hypothetical protein